ncbi:MAG: hypothetical protein IKO27_07770 [Ruminococcus sp.]|nr:hypothetical protein [Ruminococcus sp.]
MALFGHKKRTDTIPAPAAANKPTVNPDDIFGAPTPRKPKAPGADTVYIKESKYDPAKPETVGPAAIDPETIKKKMVELERELEEQKNKPVVTASDFTAENVGDKEVSAAQDDFETQYRIEHERFLKAHDNKDIVSANADDVDKKITAMVDEVESRARAREAMDLDIEHVGQDEVDRKLSDLGVAKDVTKDAEYKNIEAVSAKDMSGIEDYIHNELDTRVPPSDDDDIEAVSEQYLAKKKEEFMKQYGDRRRQD